MSGQNYIGSKISLISLSDIRYVGILHNINPVESTVALQNVKSYGTEGRKGSPKKEIPASEHVFDYVVFRGSDIKDLQVFEAPPSFQSSSEPQQVHAQQYDPTTSMATPVYLSPYYLSQQYRGNMSAYPYGNNYWQSTAYPVQQSPYLCQPHFPMPVPENYQISTPNDVPVTSIQTNVPATTLDNKEESIVNTSLQKEEKPIPSSPKKQQPFSPEKNSIIIQEKEQIVTIEHVDEALVDSLVKQVSDLDIKQPTATKEPKPAKAQLKTSEGKSDQRRTSHSHTRRSTQANGSMISNSSNGQRHHSGRRNNHNHRRNSHGIVIPKFDFDFASANAKFDKRGLKESSSLDTESDATQIIQDTDLFYDKKKSFFDDISCESKEYQNGSRSGKHKEESKLNLETFGQANPAGQNMKRHRHHGNRKSAIKKS
ncbi:hypothetical protein CU098_006863 [Rhizopus stolonifer]|uniref:FFD box profile domain-containing protein n=1 Tax=Rhizopus stolonifer TaxID=4846 RepID=A0A367J9T8_RHIST|nr:hypothetical protein CU098_006863 [Rhizopus stolonifer]